MPTVFEITTSQNNIRLDANRAGTASFTLTNISGRNLRGRLTVTADQADAQPWLSISGDGERDYSIGAVDQIDVKIAPPATAAPGTYSFSIAASDANLSDDTRTQSPSVSFELLPIVIEQKKINPLLIIIPIVVVIAIIIVLVLVLSNQGLSDAERTQTAIAAELTAELTANAARTQTAAVGAAQQTANAIASRTASVLQTQIAGQTATRHSEIGTQTAVAGSVATITAQAGATATQGALMDTFVGSWQPSPDNGTLNSINITRIGSAFTVSYNTCQPQNTSSLQCLTTPIDRTTTNVTFNGTTLTATDNLNVLVMTRQGNALRVTFRGSVFFFEPFFIFPVRTFIFIDPGTILQPIEPIFRLQGFSAPTPTPAP